VQIYKTDSFIIE